MKCRHVSFNQLEMIHINGLDSINNASDYMNGCTPPLSFLALAAASSPQPPPHHRLSLPLNARRSYYEVDKLCY